MPPDTPGVLRKVLSGPYSDSNQAKAAQQFLAAKGINGFVRELSDDPVRTVRPQLPELGTELVPAGYAAAGPIAAGAESPEPANPEPATPANRPFRFSGYLQSDAAYTFASPDHWSHFRHTAEIALEKQLATQLNFKISGRFFYDGIYDVTTYFPDRVKSDARFDAMFRETYLDTGAGDWDFRLGRQHDHLGRNGRPLFRRRRVGRDLREYSSRTSITPDSAVGGARRVLQGRLPRGSDLDSLDDLRSDRQIRQ